ncbi:hypothetical protein M422DRAFT_247582 [Sphaerobolus stellatus SS14]|nr:hypothetical protein M422DRAFT_247582 [Sphaerobolus stellatus SS14]
MTRQMKRKRATEEEESDNLQSGSDFVHHLDKGKGRELEATVNEQILADTNMISLNEELQQHFDLCYAAFTESVALIKNKIGFTKFYIGPQPRIASVQTDHTSVVPDSKLFCLHEERQKLIETILIGIEQKPLIWRNLWNLSVEEAREHEKIQAHIGSLINQAYDELKYAGEGGLGMAKDQTIPWITIVGPFWVFHEYEVPSKKQHLVRVSKGKGDKRRAFAKEVLLAEIDEEHANKILEEAVGEANSTINREKERMNWPEIQRLGVPESFQHLMNIILMMLERYDKRKAENKLAK